MELGAVMAKILDATAKIEGDKDWTQTSHKLAKCG